MHEAHQHQDNAVSNHDNKNHSDDNHTGAKIDTHGPEVNKQLGSANKETQLHKASFTTTSSPSTVGLFAWSQDIL
eukprot:3252043-Amphidinium_carterae.1